MESFTPKFYIKPNLIAGIIAQESGFDPKALNWAEAIELTQLTPLAEEQIISGFEHYPRYRNLNN